jgi:hypothetical protein
MLADRDVLIAIFAAVLAIGERLTGERMSLRLNSDSEDAFEIAAGSVSIDWSRWRRPENENLSPAYIAAGKPGWPTTRNVITATSNDIRK